MKISECRELNYYDHGPIIDRVENIRISKMMNEIEKFEVVRLQHRRRKYRNVVIHKCVKEYGKYQMTYFDDDEPISDIIRDTLKELISVVVYNYTTVIEFIRKN